MILYKYRADSKFTEKIFTERQVWLATPASLNDPFECSYNIPLDLMQEHVETACKTQIAGFVFSCVMYAKKGKTPFGIPQKDIDNFFASLQPVLSTHGHYQLFKDFQKKHGIEFSDQENTFYQLKKSLSEIGIFSLSSEIDNQLLWAHYADESRGIAIGFHASKDSKLINPEHCLKVEYTDDIIEKKDLGFSQCTEINMEHDESRPQKLRFTNNAKIAFNDSFFQRVIATKPTPWSYEREWRYVEERSGSFPLPASVCEVVFGLRTPQEIIEKYKRLSSNYCNNIKFFKMEKSSLKNALEKFPL